ncbi:unnamed protein product [Phytophthora fragariaefolia]|uniref:non-specific serine/threonine protein kinase n=1 Tax=Phytophthora fragariaefolia TaxID=1490495 RepID=A0A9W6X1J1_9STRA|nr:unnamed protein product [Phytophthora fragariaefolia]
MAPAVYPDLNQPSVPSFKIPPRSASMEGNEVYEAARVGDLERVKILVAQNTGVDKETALRSAAGEGRLDVVKYLVEQERADVDARDYVGESALIRAADRGTCIPPSEIEPVDFTQNDSNDAGYNRVKWLKADASVKIFSSDSYGSAVTDLLRHPNVVNTYGVCGVLPELKLRVCEYASQRFLTDHYTTVERATLWKHLHNAAVGLLYLHEKGVVHGDLRCNNILIGADGIAKLAKFGQTCLVTASSPDDLERWQSPEILKGHPPSYESDIYSLGMCILEAVNGRAPWGDEWA